VQPPEIRYVKCGGRDLAYEVVGSGTAGFMVFLDIGAHLDLMWTDPAWGQQVDRFGAQWRAALFQMRGIGQSEPVERLPTLEEQADDIATVMDAVGLPRAQIMGSGSTALARWCSRPRIRTASTGLCCCVPSYLGRWPTTLT
jgi:pimeloyl-ACP methyl ester carboxylesterase